jgi:hypothetical protein
VSAKLGRSVGWDELQQGDAKKCLESLLEKSQMPFAISIFEAKKVVPTSMAVSSNDMRFVMTIRAFFFY